MRIIETACILTIIIALFTSCKTNDDICMDMVAELTNAFAACLDDNPADIQDALLDSMRNCENVAGIRNEDDLYEICFPALQSSNCEDLENAILPPSCHNQILF